MPNTPWRTFKYGDWKKVDDQYDHETWGKMMEEGFDAYSDGVLTNKRIDELIDSRKKAVEACGEPPWRPKTYYNNTGDILEIYLSNEKSYAKWLTPELTVLLSQKTNEVVGFQIWGVSLVEHIEFLVDKFLAPKKEKVVKSKLSEYSRKFGVELKQVRESKDFTVKELSEVSGLPIYYIEQIENGETSSSHFARVKLSKVLETDLESIATRIHKKA